MSKSPKPTHLPDPVDVFAQQILRHPERADDLKNGFRQRIGLTTKARGSETRTAVDTSDAEDLWDNVPV